MAKQLNVNLAVKADTGQAKAQIQELQQILNKIMHTSSTTSLKGIDATKIQQAASAAKELQMHLNNAFNVNTGKFDLSLLDKSLKSTGSNITDLSTKLLNAGSTGQQAFVKLAQSISLADQPMLRINNKLSEFATTMKNTARWQLSSSMLHGFMGAVQSAYGYAQDLNESLTNIRIVTGQSSEQMAEFAEQANKAAKNLSTTTTDYTNASLIYYQQGLTDEQVSERTEVTIKMANAAGESAEKVSDQLTAVWNNFYDGSKSLEYYADVMTALGAATASSTDEIAGGLEKFAAIADTIGLSYEYAASALATITSNTRQSEEVVGTALKTIFARIQGLNLGETLDDGTTLNKYSEALQKVGISIYDSAGGLKDMDNILNEMAQKWDTLSNNQQVALAQTVAGVRQYTQLVALMDNWNDGSADSMMANLETSYGATGSLDDQAEIYAESWEAARDRVQAAAEGLYQSLLDDDFFIDVNNGFANMLSGLDAFIDGAGGLKTIIVGISSIIVSNFANKIPEAIQTAKYNIDVLTKGSAQAYQQIQKDMQEATQRAFASKGGINEHSSMGFMISSSNELSLARTKLAQISDKMSASERQLAETELSLMQQTQQETYTILQKKEALESSIDTMQKVSLSNDSISFNDSSLDGFLRVEKAFDSLNSYNIMENAESRFESVEKASGKLAEQLNIELVNALTNLSTGKELEPIKLTAGKLGEQFKVLRETINAVDLSKFKTDDDISDAKRTIMDLIGIFPKAVTESKTLKTSIESIGRAKTAEELQNRFENFKKKLEGCTLESKEFARALKTFQNPKEVEDYVNRLMEINKLSDDAKKKMQNFNQSAASFQPTHIVRTSEALGSLAGLAGGAATTINSLVSAFKNLTNPDLSGWEKMSSFLMAFSFTVPTVVSAMRSLGTVTDWIAMKNLEFITTYSLMNTISASRLSVLGQERAAELLTMAAQAKRAGATQAEIVALITKNLTEQDGIDDTLAAAMAEEVAQRAEQGRATSIAMLIGMKLADTVTQKGLNIQIGKYNVLMTIANALTGKFGSLFLVGGIAAAVGIIAGLVALFDALNTSEKETLEELDNQLEHAENAFNNVSTSIQEVNDSLSKLEDHYSTLENLTKGTTEWYEAVANANTEVLSLLEKFPQLEKYMYEDDGILKITSEGQEELQNEQAKQLQIATNIRTNAQISKQEYENIKLEDDLWYNSTTFGIESSKELSSLYNDPRVGELLFTKEGSKEVFDALLEAESELNSMAALNLGDTAENIKNNTELYNTYHELFYEDLLNNEETIKELANNQKTIATLQKSKFEGYLSSFNIQRDAESIEEMLDNKYPEVEEVSRNKVETAFGDWNDSINYSESNTSDEEWKMIEDFMKLQGDDVEYIAQRKGKMVLKIDETEVEYSKEEVYSQLTELYTGQELETQLTEAYKNTLSNALSNVNLDELNLNQLAQLDNLQIAFEASLEGTSLEDQSSELFNQLNTSLSSGEGNIQDFLASFENIDLSNAENLREFNSAALSLAEGKTSIEDFTAAMAEMNTEAQLENMGSYFESAAEQYGMDADAAKDMQAYAQYLQEIADESSELSDELTTNADSCADLAVEITRMNRGVEKLANGFDDWNDILKNSSKTSAEYAEALADMKDALGDVLDVESDLISSDFVTDHLDEIKEAAKGDEKAIDSLRSQMDEEIIQRVTLGQTEDFAADVMNLENAFKSELERINSEIPDIEVGAIIQDEGFLEAANNLVAQAGMTADEANAYFAGIGYEPVYSTEDIETNAQVPNARTTMTVESIGFSSEPISIMGKEVGFLKMPQLTYSTKSTPLPPDSAEANVRLMSFSGNSTPPKIKGLRKKATGSMNNYSSSNKGGGSPKSGGGGGGGSSSKPEAIDKTKKIDVVERYKEINDQIDDAADKMDDASKAADRLYGNNRIKSMKKVSDALEEEIKLLEKKRKEAEDYLEIDQDELENLAKKSKKKTGVSIDFDFDETGNISNYESQMTKLYNQLAKAEAKADPSNFKTKEAQDAYIEEYVTPLKEYIEELKTAIEQYDETRELVEDLDNEARDKFNEWQDNNFEILNYELELKLEVDDSELRRLEYLLSKIEDDFYSMAEAAALMIGNAVTDAEGNVTGLDTTGSQLKVYEDQFVDLQAQREALKTAYQNGEISEAQYVEGLQDLEDKAYDNAEAIQELDKTMMHYYGDTLEAAADELAQYTDMMEQHVEVLEHYANIMDIIGKSTDYESMGVILEAQAQVAENQKEVSKANYEMLNEQRNARKAEYEAALNSETATDAEIAMLKQKWLDAEAAANDAQDQMLADTEAWAEALRAVVENKLAGLSQALEDALTADFGGSFDQMAAQMERAASLQEEYLTDTNKIYETNKLINKAQQDIDKTTNTVAKKRLQSYIQETEQLQNKNKLSNYELEIQQAKYDLILAEIALEEAQNAKSTVRLQRDAEGNFGYVYTADQNKVAEAEQELADAQNRLYNIGLEGANSYTEKYQQTLSEMYDTLTELQTQYLEGAFASEEEYNQAVDNAKAYYYEKLEQYSELYGIALTTDMAVREDAWGSSFEKMTLHTDDWQAAVTEYLGNVKSVFAEWEEQVKAIREETIGPDLDALKEKTEDITTANEALEKSITKEGGVLDGIEAEIEEVNKLTAAYIKAKKSINGTTDAHETFIKSLRESIENPEKDKKKKQTEEPKEPEQTPKETDDDKDKNVDNSDKAEGVAAAIWIDGKKSGWGNDPGRKKKLKEKGVTEAQTILNTQSMDNLYSKWINRERKKYFYGSFDTGGYTGAWGPQGKLAILHEKELVLNKQDTQNFLASMDLLDKILQTIDLQAMSSQIGGFLSSPTLGQMKEEFLEQHVTIEANFPGVSMASEIEEAFENIVNLASQYANRK